MNHVATTCWIILFSLSLTCFGNKVETVRCGAWSDPQIWKNARLPTATDTVEIRHFVAFDQDFANRQPGMLLIVPEGSLCGLKRYEGHLVALGSVYLNELYLYYGKSENNAFFNIKSRMVVTGTASWRNKVPSCVGCTVTCENCLFTVTEPPPVAPEPPPPNPPVPELPLFQPSFPSHLIRNGLPANQRFGSPDDSVLVYFDLDVYNRWGLRVYKGRHEGRAWDGTDQSGHRLPPGIYFYELRYEARAQPGFRAGTGSIQDYLSIIE